MFENSEKTVYHRSVTTLFNYRKLFHPCSISFSVGMDRTESKIYTTRFTIDHYCSCWLQILGGGMWCQTTDDLNSRQCGMKGNDRRSWLHTAFDSIHVLKVNIFFTGVMDIYMPQKLVIHHLFFLTAENQLNQKRIGDTRLFDFSWKHHVCKQMAKWITGLEGDTNIRKEKWNGQGLLKHRMAEWVSDVEQSLLYDPGHEHWVTIVHGT